MILGSHVIIGSDVIVGSLDNAQMSMRRRVFILYNLYSSSIIFFGAFFAMQMFISKMLYRSFHRYQCNFGLRNHTGGHAGEASWASYQICKIAGCACTGDAGNVFPATDFKGSKDFSDPDMHHGTCVTARAVMHVGIANPRWWGKRSRHSRRMRNQQFYVSGKRPMMCSVLLW